MEIISKEDKLFLFMFFLNQTSEGFFYYYYFGSYATKLVK